MTHDVTLIPGDGTGPELITAATKCIHATGTDIHWDVQEAGSQVFEAFGTPVLETTLQSIRKTRCALKGPITTPIATGYRSANLYLRHELGLYACVRFCRQFKRKSSRNIDIIVIGENTEDLYSGVEFAAGEPDTKSLITSINEHSGHQKIRTGLEETGLSCKVTSVSASERILKFALDFARQHGRKKLTIVHKANVMKHTDGLFLQTARRITGVQSKIAIDEKTIDTVCMKLVQRPEEFDVLVAPHLYADILSDLCAGHVGGTGVIPGVNFGVDCAIFEAAHGSAPEYVGLDRLNPTALILSGVLMLQHLKEQTAADRLEHAVRQVISEEKVVTYDLSPENPASTSRMADAICNHL